MQTIIERHLTEAREALEDHERQGLIFLEEVIALENILSKTSEENIRSVREPDHAPQAPKVPTGPLYGSKRDRMETAIERFLRDNSRPMHRIQITDHLKELGITGQEHDPLGNVSNILSACPQFISVGNGLWTLKPSSEQ